MKTRWIVGLSMAALLAANPAHAGHRSGDAAAAVFGGLIVGAVIGAAAAHASQPQVIYAQPAPPPPPPPAPAPAVVYQPAPVVVQAPAPAVVYAPAPAPVVYAAPAPVYYAPPPVVYACPPPRPCPPPIFHHRPRHCGPHFRIGFSVGW